MFKINRAISVQSYCSQIFTGKYSFLFGFLVSCLIFGQILVFSNLNRSREYGQFNELFKISENMLSKSESALSHVQPKNTEIADIMNKDIRILCLVLTQYHAHNSSAQAVKNTWGKRCTTLLFVSNKVDPSLHTLVLNGANGHQWERLKQLFQQIYQYNLDVYNWFYIANDQTYTIMENMRYLLVKYSPNHPIFFGKKLKENVNQGWVSLKAGAVFSREAVRKFAEQNEEKCKRIANESEDIHIGKCMELLGIVAGDSRDSMQRETFFHVNPQSVIFFNGENARKNNDYYSRKTGMNSCSSNAITFHNVNDHEMFVMEYLIYNLNTYGIINLPQKMPKKYSFEEVQALNGITVSTTAENTSPGLVKLIKIGNNAKELTTAAINAALKHVNRTESVLSQTTLESKKAVIST